MRAVCTNKIRLFQQFSRFACFYSQTPKSHEIEEHCIRNHHVNRIYVMSIISTYKKVREPGPVSQPGGPGSIPGQVMWGLWWKSGTGVSFLRVLRSPMPILIPQPTPNSPTLLSHDNIDTV
jgi:hypothetical protein